MPLHSLHSALQHSFITCSPILPLVHAPDHIWKRGLEVPQCSLWCHLFSQIPFSFSRNIHGTAPRLNFPNTIFTLRVWHFMGLSTLYQFGFLRHPHKYQSHAHLLLAFLSDGLKDNVYFSFACMTPMPIVTLPQKFTGFKLEHSIQMNSIRCIWNIQLQHNKSN